MTTIQGPYDILIAGQGAAAFAAGLYAARYQTKVIVIGETFGGETAIGGLIENYPGYVDIDGFDLMMHFREQVEKYGVPIVDDKVTKVVGVEGCYEVETEYSGAYQTQTVILGIGRERRKLGLPNEEEWTGKGVSFCSVCDAPLHKDNVVAVVGGGNAAVEGAVPPRQVRDAGLPHLSRFRVLPARAHHRRRVEPHAQRHPVARNQRRRADWNERPRGHPPRQSVQRLRRDARRRHLHRDRGPIRAPTSPRNSASTSTTRTR